MCFSRTPFQDLLRWVIQRRNWSHHRSTPASFPPRIRDNTVYPLLMHQYPILPLSYLQSQYLYHTPIEHIQVPISQSYSQGFGTTENLMYWARGHLDSKTSIISHHNFEREKSSYSSDSIRTDCSQNFLKPLLYESMNGILTSRKLIVPSVVLVSHVGGECIHIPYTCQMREVVLTGLEGWMCRWFRKKVSK